MRYKKVPVYLLARLLVLTLTLILASGAWAAPKYKVLYKFTGGSDGGASQSPLIFDKAGNLYGMTYLGGQKGGCFAGLGCGTVFELTPGSGAGWAESVLYAFTGGADGGNPIFGGLIFDANGNLYGTTSFGGIFGGPCDPYGCGTVFELAPGSQDWTESVLYSFTGTSGAEPLSTLTFDNKGRLYGTTTSGGLESVGTIVQLVKTNGGTWKETTIHQFGRNDGSSPVAGLIPDAASNLYGTTSVGGATNGGTVFELTNNSRKVTMLHSFQCGLNKCNSKDGGNPWSSLVFDQHGNLYGATRLGGTHRNGAIYKLTPSKGGKWKVSVLYSFKGGSGDGAEPFSTLVFDKFGNIYGTASGGGNNSNGIVFKLAPGTGGRWKETILHRFSGGGNGSRPFAGLVMDAAGNLYGTTDEGGNAGCGKNGCGVVFEVTP
jgi:uncharacterized repeat protein (TIGR03803 family)